ncbi:hypothetical protein CYMTET_43561 [Cymbomonas tetramitiformis]|uniref:Uncharacterized protein n=1 Tax=Cymbomonas tetramitiformis TaxID=36881 RepID=A0AAE0F0H9_9CHLO|nr:hypothetical protein CYMTET_43561 [Cymbomonas tetramitiformis]
MTTRTDWSPEWFTSGLDASFYGPRDTDDAKPLILAVFGTLLVAIASTFLLLRLRLHLRTSISQSLSKTLKDHGKHRAKRFVPAPHSWEVQDTGLTIPQVCEVCNELLADQYDLLAEQFQAPLAPRHTLSLRACFLGRAAYATPCLTASCKREHCAVLLLIPGTFYARLRRPA